MNVPFRTDSLLRFIVWAGAAALLVPALYVPLFLYPYIFGRAIFFQLVVEAMAVAWVLLLVRQPERYRPCLHISTIFFAVFVGISLVASLFGVDPARSVWGTELRMTGWFTLLHAFAYLVILSSSLSAERDWRRLLSFGSMVMAVITAIAIVERFSPAFRSAIGGGERVLSTAGNPIFLAAILLFGIPMAGWLAATSRGRTRALWSALAAAETLALFFTETRGALISFIVTAFVLLAGVVILGRGRRLRTASAIILLFAIAAGFGAYLTRDHPFWLSAPAIRKLTHLDLRASTSETRLLSWAIAVDGIRERPILGWGPENYGAVFDRHYRPELLRFGFYETVSDKPHNNPLEIAVAAGLPALAAYLAAFVALIVSLVGGYRRGSIDGPTVLMGCGALLAYQIQNFFELDTPNTYVLLALTFAFLTSKLRARAPDTRPTTAPRVPTAALAVLLVGFVPFAYIGNFAPLSGSWDANQSLRLSGRDPILWKDPALRAIRSGGPHARELRVVVTREFLNWEASGRIPAAVVTDVVPAFITQMQKSVASRNPTFQEHFMLAQLLILKGEYLGDEQAYRDAEAELARAAELSPERQAAPFLLGRLFIMTERPERAVEILRAVLQKDASVAEAHWFYGLGLLATGKRSEGIHELEEALRLGRTLEKTSEIQYLIDLYAEEENYAPIVPLYELLIQRDPTRADWHAQLAATYAKLGRTELAILEAQRAAELDPSFAASAQAFIKSLQKKEASSP